MKNYAETWLSDVIECLEELVCNYTLSGHTKRKQEVEELIEYLQITNEN